VAVDEHSVSKGYGFIHFDSQEAADKAAAVVNGKLLNGKKCYVGPFVSRKEREIEEGSSTKWTNIYAKNFDKTWDDDKLKAIFQVYGAITSCVVMRDDKGESKGFGFINFDKNDEAQNAINELNGKDFDGKQMYVGRAQKKSEREKELKDMFNKIQQERMNKYQGVNLYVKNLDDSIDDERLRKEFSACGTITSAKVMTDEKKNSKGFGFVCFSTPEEATKAVTEFNGKLINNKPIYVALAQRKDQRRAALEAQHQQRANGIRLQQQAQAAGMAGSPLYGPVFYPPTRGGFMYPGMVPARGGRFPAQARGMPPQGYMAPFMVPPQAQQQGGRGMPKGRGGMKGSRGGGVGPMQGYPMGIKYNPNVRNQQVPVAPQVAQETVATQITDSERRQQIGETLYPLIGGVLRASNQEDLTGKVTGMFLEASDIPELLQLLESSEALTKKVQEALDVLAVHAEAKKDG